MPIWMRLWNPIAQTPPPNGDIGETVEQAAQALERLGGISPAVQITAGITILLGFMLLIVVYEWRRANTESAFRDALQRQADYAQGKRLESDKRLDEESLLRRELQDTVARLQRKVEDCVDSEAKYTNLIQEFEAYKQLAARQRRGFGEGFTLDPEGD